MPRQFGPKTPESAAASLNRPCRACNVPFVAGDFTALVLLGPGDDPDAQKAMAEGRAYNGVAIEVHWSCATGLPNEKVE